MHNQQQHSHNASRHSHNLSVGSFPPTVSTNKQHSEQATTSFINNSRSHHHSNPSVIYPEDITVPEVAAIRNTASGGSLGPPVIENDPHSTASTATNFVDTIGRSPSDDEQQLIVGKENVNSSGDHVNSNYQHTERSSFPKESNTPANVKFYAATTTTVVAPEKEKLAFDNQAALADIEHEEAEADKGSLRSSPLYYYHQQPSLSQEMPSHAPPQPPLRRNNNIQSPYNSQQSITQQQPNNNKSVTYPGRALPSPADAALNAFASVAQQNPAASRYGGADSRISLTPSALEAAGTTPTSFEESLNIEYITPSHTGASDVVVGSAGDSAAPRSRSRRRSDRYNHQVKPLQDVTNKYVAANANSTSSSSVSGVNNKIFSHKTPPFKHDKRGESSDAVASSPAVSSSGAAGDRSRSTSSSTGSTSMSAGEDAVGDRAIVVNELDAASTATPVKTKAVKKRFIASVSTVDEAAAAASSGDKENRIHSFSRQPSSTGAKLRRGSGKLRELNIADAAGGAISTTPSPVSLDGSTSSHAPVIIPSSQSGLSPMPSPQPPSSSSKYVKFTDVFDTDRRFQNRSHSKSGNHPTGINKSKSVPAGPEPYDSAVIPTYDAIQVQDMYRQLNNSDSRAGSAAVSIGDRYKVGNDERILISRADTIAGEYPEHPHSLGAASYGASSPDLTGSNNSIVANGLHHSRGNDAATPVSFGLSTTNGGPNVLRSRTNSGSSSSSTSTAELQFLRTHRELLKTLVAIIFLLIGWLATISALAYSHDRIPMTEPLPDIIFSIVPIQAWALKYSEYVIVLGLVSVVIMVITHKYRWVVFRRICIIVGLLYMGRSVTMLVTGLPPPDINYPCEEQLKHTAGGVVIKRILQFLVGGGMSFRGYYTLCGDYIYSGHTCVLVVFYLLLREYAPRKLFILTVIYGILSVCGIILVSISRGHYTVDIVIAYWVTTRTFWIYHSLASNPTLKNRSNTNYLSRVWWFPIFHYLEGNVPASKLPNHFEWPLPWPRRWVSNPSRR